VATIVRAFDASCSVYREALDHGVDKFLVGAAIRPVFRKWNACLQACPSTPCPHEQECRNAR